MTTPALEQEDFPDVRPCPCPFCDSGNLEAGEQACADCVAEEREQYGRVVGGESDEVRE